MPLVSIGRDHVIVCTANPSPYLHIVQCHKVNARFAAPNAPKTQVRMLPLFPAAHRQFPPAPLFADALLQPKTDVNGNPKHWFPCQIPSPMMPCLCVYKIIVTCLPMCVGMQRFHMFSQPPWPPPLLDPGGQPRIPAPTRQQKQSVYKSERIYRRDVRVSVRDS